MQPDTAGPRRNNRRALLASTTAATECQKTDVTHDARVDVAQDIKFCRISEATQRFPFSRSTIYREAAAGRIKLVKLNGATIVDCDSVRARLASLPEAPIRRTNTSH
jgi:hypothetical protein